MTDLLKGFIMAILGALLASIYSVFNAGTLNFTWTFWQPILLSAFGAGISYLIKNFFTNSNNQILKTEQS